MKRDEDLPGLESKITLDDQTILPAALQQKEHPVISSETDNTATTALKITEEVLDSILKQYYF